MINKIVHIFINTLLAIFGALVLLFISLQLPPVQNFIAQKVVQKVNENYNIPLSIDEISIRFFNNVKVKNITLTTHDQDTVFYASDIMVRMKLIRLLDNQIHISKIGLNGARINLEKEAGDSIYNVEYLFRSIPLQEEKQEAKPPPGFALDRLMLEDLHFQLEDHVDSNSYFVQLDQFDLRTNSIDLPDQKIALHSIAIDGAKIDIMQSPSTPAEHSEPFPYQISLENELTIKNVNFSLYDRLTKQQTSVQHAHLSVRANHLDIQNQHIALEYVELNNTSINLLQERLSKADSAEIDSLQINDTNNEFAWDIRLENLKLQENQFRQINQNIPDTGQGFQADSFILSNVHADIRQIAIKKDTYAADIRTLGVNINNRFEIKNMKALATINSHSAVLNDVHMTSENSSVTFDARVNYHDLNQLADRPEDISLYLKIKAETGPEDLRLLLPVLTTLKKYPDITLAGTFNGNLSSLHMDNMTLNAGNAIDLNLQGQVSNLHDIKQISGQLFINDLFIYQQALITYLPDTLIPQTIQLPDTIQLQGQANGSRSTITSDLKLMTSFGNMNSHFYFNFDSIPGKEHFAAQLDIDHFDAGKLLNKPDSIGKLALTGDISGQLTQFSNPALNMDILIQHIDLLGYPYQDITINGDYRKKYFKGSTSVNDTSIAFQFNGTVDLSDSIPLFHADLQVRHAHLEQLGVTPERTDVSGNISMNVTGMQWNQLKGDISAGNLSYATHDQSYTLDSINVDLIQQPDSSNYRVRVNNLAKDDSLLVGRADIHALIQGYSADIQYQLWQDVPVDESIDAWVQGHGNMLLTQDSLWIKNHIRVARSLYPEPVQVDMMLSHVNTGPDMHDVNLQMIGMGVRLNASGQLNKQDGEDIAHLQIGLDSLDLALVEPFVTNQFETLEGHVKGQFQVNGPVKDPDINGSMSLKKTTINPNALNTDFIFTDEQIKVNNSIFQFDQLKVKDHANQEAVLDGTINLNKDAASNFNLSFQANSFRLFNKKSTTSEMYYGQVIVDLDAHISGSFSSPVITMNLGFNDKSDIHYVIPQQNVNAKQNEGVVEFVNIQEERNDTADTNKIQPEMKSQMKGIELNANLEITDKLAVTIVTDPASDENLDISGNGNLTYTINKGGNMSLTGRYEIDKGKYKLRLYDFMTREFEIEKGSSLTWTGDVLGATANIAAVYKLRTSPGNLLPAQETGSQQYRGAIPFEVVMNLTGNLLTPDIDFDIRVDKRFHGSEIHSVITNLNENESELNKQVFSLLIFNRFSSEMLGGNNAMAYNLQNTAMESLSNVLSEQLNRFSRQYIKGVDVSFDIDAYGQVNRQDISSRTNLNVDVSRNLFSDRLTIEVGGRVAVQENNQKETNSSASNNLAGDFKLEYKLSKDGTYRLQAFNKPEYEDEIESEVTKTGVSFIFNKDFTNLKDLFNKKKNKEK